MDLNELNNLINELKLTLAAQRADITNNRMEVISSRAAVIERLITIELTLESLDESVDELKTRLFGGLGQSGILTDIEERTNKLEKWFWRATGALSIIMVGLNLILQLRH